MSPKSGTYTKVSENVLPPLSVFQTNGSSGYTIICTPYSPNTVPLLKPQIHFFQTHSALLATSGYRHNVTSTPHRGAVLVTVPSSDTPDFTIRINSYSLVFSVTERLNDTGGQQRFHPHCESEQHGLWTILQRSQKPTWSSRIPTAMKNSNLIFQDTVESFLNHLP